MKRDEAAALAETVRSPVVRTRAATITSTDPAQLEGAEPTTASADLPAAIARYRITGRLGAGGMGVVYAAHDPALDRQVAIKVVDRQTASGELDQRLEREAQALARLDHPNVVTVYDAGVDDNRLYIVMQLVDGETLRDKLDAGPPSRDAVLGWFLDAGRGLAAVHAAGLVHRDFKPSNVLVDPAGVAKVTDFGLARLSDLAEPVGTGAPMVSDTALLRSMTQGKIVGTPAYMAPEQFLGGPITAASDQFAFCIALWEGLTGKRPFAGATFEALRRHVVTGVVTPPAARLPSRIERALRRGLSVHVPDRWPDLESLLAALAPRRRRAGLVAGALFATAGVVTLVAARVGASDPCAGVDTAIDAVWPARMPEVARALATVPIAGGGHDHAIAATLGYLNDRAARWRFDRRDACEATEVRNAQPAALRDRRVICLDHSLAGLTAAIDEIAHATAAEHVLRAPAVAAAGGDPDQCRGDQIERAPAQPAAPAALWKRALEIDAALAAGRPAKALADGKQLIAEVEKTGDHQLAAYVWSKIADAGDDVSTADARDATRRAAEAAAAAGDDALAAERWGHAAVVAASAGDLAAVDDLMAAARAAAARTKDPDTALWIDAFAGKIEIDHPDTDAALATCGRVLDRAAGKPRIADYALECVTLALIRGNRWKEAEPWANRLVARLTESSGPEHPNTIYARLKLAVVHYHQDRPRGERESDAVIADLARLFGADSPHLMDALSIVSNTELELDGNSNERSRRYAKQALDIGTRILPADDTKLARLYFVWGQSAITDGQPVNHHDDARAAYRHAMAIYERRRADFDWATLGMAMAQMDRDDHDCPSAVVMLHQVASLADAGRLPPTMGDAARAETGVCAFQTGDAAGAIKPLAAAVAAFDPVDIEWAAQYRLWWAKAEAKLGHAAEARRLVREILDKLPPENDLRIALRRDAGELARTLATK